MTFTWPRRYWRRPGTCRQGSGSPCPQQPSLTGCDPVQSSSSSSGGPPTVANMQTSESQAEASQTPSHSSVLELSLPGPVDWQRIGDAQGVEALLTTNPALEHLTTCPAPRNLTCWPEGSGGTALQLTSPSPAHSTKIPINTETD